MVSDDSLVMNIMMVSSGAGFPISAPPTTYDPMPVSCAYVLSGNKLGKERLLMVKENTDMLEGA